MHILPDRQTNQPYIHALSLRTNGDITSVTEATSSGDKTKDSKDKHDLICAITDMYHLNWIS